MGYMVTLPITSESLLVRTDFAGAHAWEESRDAALGVNEDGFAAYVHLVDDPEFCGARWQDLREQARAAKEHAAVLFVMDGPAMTGEHPVLVVDLDDEARAPFRCIAKELWSVDNNLNLANMDWEEFADEVHADGVFRGFTASH